MKIEFLFLDEYFKIVLPYGFRNRRDGRMTGMRDRRTGGGEALYAQVTDPRLSYSNKRAPRVR